MNILHSYFKRIILLGITGFLLFPVTGGSADFSFDSCKEMCAGFEGITYSKCLNRCLSNRKRDKFNRGNATKKKIEDCETICNAYKGLDNVKCTRLCLERYENQSGNRQNRTGSTIRPKPTVCEQRCSALNGANRHKCIRRCKQNQKFNR